MSRWITIYNTPRLFEPLDVTITVSDIGNNRYCTHVSYKLEGVQHRRDGPASINYNPNNGWSLVNWCVDGKLHRTNGPAFVQTNCWNPIECWYYKGKESRLDGPSLVTAANIPIYYIDGIEYSEIEYWKSERTMRTAKKVGRRWRMWRMPKILNCWRWINSVDGQKHFFGERGAGRKAHIRELNKLVIAK
jgi:hypothetical protein